VQLMREMLRRAEEANDIHDKLLAAEARIEQLEEDNARLRLGKVS
jgi:hypothetical protein